MSYPVGLLDAMTKVLDDEAKARRRAESRAKAKGTGRRRG